MTLVRFKDGTMICTRMVLSVVALLTLAAIFDRVRFAHVAADDAPIIRRTVAPMLRPVTDLYGDHRPAGAMARIGAVRMAHLGLADFHLTPDNKTVRTFSQNGWIRS